MRYAVSLGADDRVWLRSQFTRMSDGLNRKTSARQTVFYFDPETISLKNSSGCSPKRELQPETSVSCQSIIGLVPLSTPPLSRRRGRRQRPRNLPKTRRRRPPVRRRGNNSRLPQRPPDFCHGASETCAGVERRAGCRAAESSPWPKWREAHYDDRFADPGL